MIMSVDVMPFMAYNIKCWMLHSDCLNLTPALCLRNESVTTRAGFFMVDMKTKICTECKKELPISEYYICKSGKDAGKPKCKCIACLKKIQTSPEWREKQRKYYAKNKERYRKYRIASKDARSKWSKEWVKANKDKICETNKKYYIDNKETILKSNNKYRQKRYANDPKYRALINTKDRFRQIIASKESDQFHKLLGCTRKKLIEHLESNFEDGMSWENYGFEGWHIDHIIPCASFDLTDEEQQKKCFHYTNLQPLWGTENMMKQDLMPDEWRKKKQTLIRSNTI